MFGVPKRGGVMRGLRIRKIRWMVCGAGAVAALVVTAAAVMGAGNGGVRGSKAVSPSDPQAAACMARGEVNCNPDPGVYATFVASNPIAHAPRANPHYITEADVLTRARGGNTGALAKAALVSYHAVSNLQPGLGSNGVIHPERKVWVVTVHGDIETRGSLRSKPTVVHVYSLVIDAETGIVTDMCYGCEAVK
jgi:hypothetical protein